MAEPLDRDGVIRLLDKLGSDEDTDVLKAARDLHSQITAAELDWDELLMPEDRAEADDSEQESLDAPVASGSASDDETLALIEKLLSDSGRSEALREELEEYRADIAEGDFSAKDHQYVRALYQRLK